MTCVNRYSKINALLMIIFLLLLAVIQKRSISFRSNSNWKNPIRWYDLNWVKMYMWSAQNESYDLFIFLFAFFYCISYVHCSSSLLKKKECLLSQDRLVRKMCRHTEWKAKFQTITIECEEKRLFITIETVLQGSKYLSSAYIYIFLPMQWTEWKTPRYRSEFYEFTLYIA